MNGPETVFRPAWWCRGAHTQTIVGRFYRQRRPHAVKRRRLDTPDGDFLDLDFLTVSETGRSADQPLVVILHGLEGSSQAPYVLTLLAEIQKRGWDAVAMNMRMCSGEMNRLQKTYHSGKTEDLDWVLHVLKKENPDQKIFLVGFSIGGNIVLKWLGEQGEKARESVMSAAAISVPYDLVQSVELMDRGFNREVYTRSLLSGLKSKVRAKQARFPDAVRYDVVRQCSTFRVFDREVTAKLNGFKDEMDYWQRSSSGPLLKDVRVPSLLIHAEDDPFFPGAYLPYQAVRESSFLHSLFVPKGGHVGFVAGTWPWQQDRWLELRILEFLDFVYNRGIESTELKA